MFSDRIGDALAHALGKVTHMSKGKVLVVMSSASALDLKEGKTYATGYYLNEFVVPYRKLVEAGYEPVIANPNGDRPVMDSSTTPSTPWRRPAHASRPSPTGTPTWWSIAS
jgi:hypothetical protein